MELACKKALLGRVFVSIEVLQTGDRLFSITLEM
jgi:hypothetical protein